MPDDGPRKPFAAFVQEQRNGSLHAELSEAVTELVSAARETGRAGSFIAEQPYKLTARLRFRLDSGNLKLGYLLDRPDTIKRDALEGVAEKLAAAFPNTYVGEAPS